MKNYKTLTVLLTALVTCAVSSASALTDAQIASVKKAFDKVPVAELAGKARQLVAQAPAADKESLAVTVTRTVIAKNPAVAVSVVSAIVSVAPEAAPAVAAAAATLVKNHAEAIAVAAVKAAPDYAEKIAQAVAAAAPGSAAKVMARVPRTARSATTPSTTGTITITPGPIRGLAFLPVNPPSPPATAPIVGFDQRRYSAP